MNDRRCMQRYECHFPFYWTYPGLHFFHTAKLLNGNESGFCLQTERFLKPGVFIFVRSAGQMTAAAGVKHTALAEIRWCCESFEVDGSPTFWAGAQYCTF